MVHYGVRRTTNGSIMNSSPNGPGAPAEDDHGRCQRLSADHRFRGWAKLRARWGRICWLTSRISPAWSSAGLHPSPVDHADFVTTTTHKTLRGPRGGLILCKEKYAKEIDSQVFPGHPGRTADACDRGQGGLFPGSAAAGVQATSADHPQRPGFGRRDEAAIASAGERRNRQPPDARGRGRERA